MITAKNFDGRPAYFVNFLFCNNAIDSVIFEIKSLFILMSKDGFYLENPGLFHNLLLLVEEQFVFRSKISNEAILLYSAILI